jgi:hypothetical protein
MDRRVFLKMTGAVAAGGALGAGVVAAGRATSAIPALPTAAGATASAAAPVASGPRLRITEPGTYRLSGRVVLDAPLVEIGGITNSQVISWSANGGAQAPTATFSTFEYFGKPGLTPAITVRGGRLESLSAEPLDLE